MVQYSNLEKVKDLFKQNKMRLMDFFKPAWQSENQEKALEAVKKIFKENKLNQIANQATNEGVKKAAVLKLICCNKCGVSKAILDKQNHIQEESIKKQMNVRIRLNMNRRGMLKCLYCGKIVCDKCALELPGHDIKSCPFCQKTYKIGSDIY